MESIGCFFLYPAFWLVLFPVIWLANRPEMVTSDWSDFLAVDWVDTSQSVVFLCQSKRPLCILSRLVTGSIEAALSFLSFFFLNFIFFSFFFIHFFSSTKYNKDYIHCNTWHCLHSGVSTDMVMSSWGLERYQAALDLHLSTSGIGRNPRRLHGMRGVVCYSSNNNDECASVTLDSLPSRTR